MAKLIEDSLQKPKHDWPCGFGIQGNSNPHLLSVGSPLARDVRKLDTSEFLEQSYNQILGLHLCEIFPKADSWAVVEWKEFPDLRIPLVPTVWIEGVGISAN